MSKTKKSMEELLEEALVPEEEQPYEVPENWVWTKAEFIAKWGSGGTPSRNKPEYYNGNVPWLKTGELNDNIILESEEKISEEGLKKSSAKLFPKGSVALAMYGATIGKLGILGIEAATNQACAVGIPYPITDKKFMFYFFLSQRKNLIEMGKGGAQPNISQTLIKEFPYPLPPLHEQKRITEKVERLLNKIEEAKELIEEAKQTFELRRAAILDKAFRGELSEKWRRKNTDKVNHVDANKNIEGRYKLPFGWNWFKLGDVFELFSGKGFKKSEYSTSGIRLMKIQNVSYREIIWEDVTFLPNDYLEKESKLALKAGDILIALNRPITNNKLKVAILDENDTPSILYQRVGCLRPKIEVNKQYLFLLFTTSYFLNQIQDRLIGSDQPYINLPPLKNILIPIPPLEEQEYIVDIISGLLEGMEISNELIKDTCQFELLKQTILSKAFQGELGTNDPSEESAIELLKEVLQEQIK